MLILTHKRRLSSDGEKPFSVGDHFIFDGALALANSAAAIGTSYPRRTVEISTASGMRRHWRVRARIGMGPPLEIYPFEITCSLGERRWVSRALETQIRTTQPIFNFDDANAALVQWADHIIAKITVT